MLSLTKVFSSFPVTIAGEIVGKLPDDKTELIEGGIYIDKGVMKRHRKGVFYTVTEKGFSQAPKSKK